MRKRLKRMAAVLCVMVCIVVMAVGCGGTDDKSETKKETEQTQKKENVLEDGIYTADFKTDSSMFHVSEACKGKGTLTVKDGEMTIHISLTSKNIVNLYPDLQRMLRRKRRASAADHRYGYLQRWYDRRSERV